MLGDEASAKDRLAGIADGPRGAALMVPQIDWFICRLVHLAGRQAQD